MDLPAQRPPLVLSLNVGSSVLEVAVRDPGLRLHIELSGLDGPEARPTVGAAGSSGERVVVHRIDRQARAVLRSAPSAAGAPA